MHTNASPSLLTCDMHFNFFFFNTKIKFSLIKRKWGEAQVHWEYTTPIGHLKKIYIKKKKDKINMSAKIINK